MNCWQQQQRAKVPFQPHPLWRLDEISLSRAEREWEKGTFAASIEEKRGRRRRRQDLERVFCTSFFRERHAGSESYWGAVAAVFEFEFDRGPTNFVSNRTPLPLGPRKRSSPAPSVSGRQVRTVASHRPPLSKEIRFTTT